MDATFPLKQRIGTIKFHQQEGVQLHCLQCICNENTSFTDAYTGWPGSVHDARVYKTSPIYDELSKLSPEFHILGDSAYLLSASLLTPFKETGCLNEQQPREDPG
jgi:hypothetical protein